jgi:hypothetical protein
VYLAVDYPSKPALIAAVANCLFNELVDKEKLASNLKAAKNRLDQQANEERDRQLLKPRK